ncbi:MAG: hypothetical protein ACP5VE_03980 [Chthonomonadales bacterium]
MAIRRTNPSGSWRFGSLLRWAMPALLPLAFAFGVVWGGPFLLEFVRLRPGAVPVALFTLLVGLLLPRFREGLITSLCFMVALLAWQDARTPLADAIPREWDYTLTERLYPILWCAVTAWALATGFVVAYRPQSPAGRRSYFGLASAYFTLHGGLSLLHAFSMDGMLMVAAGIAALVAALRVHRFWGGAATMGTSMQGEVLPDEERARRAARVAAREWRDQPEHHAKFC